jgi:hypothetical protein
MKRLFVILATIALAAAAVAALRAQAAPPKLPGVRIADPIDYLVNTAVIGEPRSYRDLTIYPVITRPVPGFGRVYALDDAMQRGWLEITEYAGGSVNEVTAANRSDRNIFMMSSEMLKGAKQDRIIRDDVLLRPRASARIPVYCVEQHRWTGLNDRFSTAGANVSPTLRASATAAPSQTQVWADVLKQQTELGVRSPTGSARIVYESRDVQQQAQPYRDKFSDLPDLDPRCSGVVVVTRGSITVADIFYEPALFRSLWAKLLDSYVVDTLTPPPGYALSGMPPRIDPRGFLQRVLQATRQPKDTAGAGQAYDLRGNGIMGAALVQDQALVHLGLFPTMSVEPLRMPGVGWRRQELQRDR